MLKVQKYGGTSVGDIERIRAVAENVVATKRGGDDIVVVVSAMAGETDRLLKLVGSMSNEPSGREKDLIVSTGEQVSVGLLTMAINKLGEEALPLMSYQIPILTNDRYSEAEILGINVDGIRKMLKEGKIVVVPGFQGVDRDGNITTLGRGGSDTSAVAIATAIKADLCEIYTDVDGIYTADPSVYHEAKKLKKITYQELLEMAGAGAKVMHLRAMELASKYNITLKIRSSFDFENDGTDITHAKKGMEAPAISTITNTTGDARISIRRVPERLGIVASIFTPIADAGINVDTIAKTVGHDGHSEIAFTVSKDNLKRAMQLTESVAKKLGAGEVEVAGDMAKVSIIGIGMRSHIGVAAKMFDVVAKNNIVIHIISSSEIKTTIVIDRKDISLAVSALHEAFGLDR